MSDDFLVFYDDPVATEYSREGLNEFAVWWAYFSNEEKKCRAEQERLALIEAAEKQRRDALARIEENRKRIAKILNR